MDGVEGSRMQKQIKCCLRMCGDIIYVVQSYRRNCNFNAKRLASLAICG